MDLDEVAGRLYGLPPSEFTAAREAEARAAKDAGDVRLARDIAGLRKPTVSASAVNRLAREHPDDLGELLALGRELREAWERHDAEALAELTRRRGELAGRLSRLIRRAAGLSAAAAAEAEQTLDAAVVDAGAAEEVRHGRLAKPLSYSGFAPAPAPRGKPAKKPTDSTASADSASEAKGAAAKGAAAKSAEAKRAEAKRREEAEAKRRAEVEARKAAERQEALEAHREWVTALEQAVQEHDERAERVAGLERKLAKARKRLAESAQRLEVAQREERHARHRVER
ncbi:hypothetical protein [Nonomuraea aurantiaca]|uniref:hypothetical protein n=1 Tax=Nonomuraea aurantiaca TaxID=2878562 RepID=UPI001CD9F6E6|nr:hypothetical protein [Nonomuraea aurantiaca]MCA2222303.1 hypothetical protein [Nonomuraea aurantiaca]